MDKETIFAGGCLCGAVRYESSEPPIRTTICHCRMCQKSTGSAFMVAVGFPRTTLRVTKGEPKLYRSSPIMDKSFCANCEPQPLMKPAALPAPFLVPNSMAAVALSIESGPKSSPERYYPSAQENDQTASCHSRHRNFCP